MKFNITFDDGTIDRAYDLDLFDTEPFEKFVEAHPVLFPLRYSASEAKREVSRMRGEPIYWLDTIVCVAPVTPLIHFSSFQDPDLLHRLVQEVDRHLWFAIGLGVVTNGSGLLFCGVRRSAVRRQIRFTGHESSKLTQIFGGYPEIRYNNVIPGLRIILIQICVFAYLF